MATALTLTKYDVQGLCQRYWSEKKRENETETKKNCKKTESKLKVLNYDLKLTSDTPTGFLSFQYFLNVQLSITNSNGLETIENLRFFSKLAPVENESRMNYLEEFGVFKKEIVFYRDVMPCIEAIFPQIAPKCYYATDNILIFEDLGLQGFKMAAGRDGLLDYKHLKCALKKLSALHAGSIVYEVQTGNKMNEVFKETLKENAYPLNFLKEHIRMKNFSKATEVMKEIIKILPKYQKDLNYILEHVTEKMSKIFELAQTSTKYQNVLSHADIWANNIMYQYADDGDGDQGDVEPTQCRLVDFQLARYAPPMLDLITVLTIPTSREFRANYLQQLIEDYYNFMSEYLKSAGLSIEDYIPKTEFQQSFEEFQICGLIESILFSHLTILPQQLVQNLTGSSTGFEEFFNEKRAEICLLAFNSDDIYRTRLSDMIEDFVDNFILQ